jgi:hypothetical protein
MITAARECIGQTANMRTALSSGRDSQGAHSIMRAALVASLAVAWLCWVPNALWAEWYIRRTASVSLPTVEVRAA